MLTLKNIVKDYKVAGKQFRAVNDISLTLNKGEFVAIIGPSGCGKTTTLNIIGGLDRYTSGDLIINGTSTKDFSEKDWDAYRNNSIGFVFQSYNLISHLSVLDNVELGMTLSGVNQKIRRERAIEVLTRVGLASQLGKRPNKLSGGEKQRVAIARALVNDPDIILADEPTGALDSKTAHEILTLIQEVAKDKLVIMVTHAQQYADEFASRIVELKDGVILADSQKEPVVSEDTGYQANKTSMSFFTALKLSFNNLKTKKFRTVITAFASSIGIIGVGLVLAISNGFSQQINDIESDQLVGLPILIGKSEMNIGFDRAGASVFQPEDYEPDEIVIYDSSMDVHTNIITNEFITYLENMNSDIYTNIHYTYGYIPVILSTESGATELVNLDDVGFSSFITPEDELEEYYDLKDGSFPTNIYQVVLEIKEWNVVNKEVLDALGFDTSSELRFSDITGTELYIAKNNDLYVEQGSLFVPNYSDLETVKNNGIVIEIVGIVQAKDSTMTYGPTGLLYLYDLQDELLSVNSGSDICLAQETLDTSVFNLSLLTEEEKLGILSYIGCNSTDPYLIQIYSDSVENKTTIKEYIATYNADKDLDDKIFETDLAEAIGATLSTLITSISVVLSAFASISLIVSSVMIGIIIYISVLERTKEIGIIRSLGGRKKDISRVFNAESIIIGAFAGLMGISITYLLTFPINVIAANVDPSLASVATSNPLHLVLLVLASTILTFIGGFIPSRIASKKNPVEALRVE